ncbi:MAG: hypothetical protein ABJD11_12510 [Gemmatimonadota bacterium]
MRQSFLSHATPCSSPRVVGLLVTVLAIVSVACGDRSPAGQTGDHSQKLAANAPRISACALMPRSELNAIIGTAYDSAEADDDGHSSESGCHYMSATDPAGTSLTIQWITADEYSNSVEHAAQQKASLGGATLAGKLMGSSGGGPSLPGLHGGPIEGLGDEATLNYLLLTVRKGDYTIMIQTIPTDMMAFMTDSTKPIAAVDKEKAVVRKVLEKL